MLALGRKGNRGVRGGLPPRCLEAEGSVPAHGGPDARTRFLTRMQVPTFTLAAEPSAPRTAPQAHARRERTAACSLGLTPS